MIEILSQEHLDCVDDINEFIEDYVVENIETQMEAQGTITKFEQLLGKFKRCHSQLHLALADRYEDNYREIAAFKIKSRNYLQNLEARKRVLVREERLHSEKLDAEMEERNRVLKDSLFQQKLQQWRDERTRDRQHTEKLEIFRLEASAIVAQDAMMLEDASAYSRCDMEEIERLISEAKTHLKDFRVTHLRIDMNRAKYCLMRPR